MTHIPVLKDDVIDQFDYLKKRSGYFVDGTLGLAGHSLEIAKINSALKIIGIDADQQALDEAKKRISKAGMQKNFILVHNNFKNINEILDELKTKKINGALLDLGVSSMQFDNKERGFSFQDPDRLLDMRMDQTKEFTAAKILSSYTESQLAKILFEYGEERNANKIAKNITLARKKSALKTVGDLLEVLKISIPKRDQFGKIHFATKTFQALRIEVNAELDKLDVALREFVDALKPGGRLAVISFHSLEDRIVKKTFQSLEDPCQCPPKMPCVCGLTPLVKIITKKPLVASEAEIDLNPRSRSAKMRVVEKIRAES